MMVQSINLMDRHYFNRKQECELFRQILYNQTALRGMIIHSNGEGGLGKSYLLQMFKEACKDPSLPTTYHPIFFDASRFSNWQDIMDRTVSQLGKAHFETYLQLRVIISPSALKRITAHDGKGTLQIYETHIHGDVQGVVHTGSGNIESIPAPALSKTALGNSQHSSYAEEWAWTPKDARKELTRHFLQDLNAVTEPYQLVWLVDTTELLDDETCLWLEEIFWEISEQTIRRLILIVAGKNRLTWKPAWSDYIKDLPIGKFTVDHAFDILQEVQPTKDVNYAKALANLLIEQSGGKPSELILAIKEISTWLT